MANIIYKDNKVYTVFGTRFDEITYFLIDINGSWQWVPVGECVPHYTSMPMINGTAN